jgi:hypothetical protein
MWVWNMATDSTLIKSIWNQDGGDIILTKEKIIQEANYLFN